MKKLIKITIMALALSTTSLIAGGGHAHDANGGHGNHAPVSDTVAKKKALKIVDSFVTKNVIDKSWATASISSAERKIIKGNDEWVVIFTNPKMEDKKKQKLYLFLSASGQYIAANYTGN